MIEYYKAQIAECQKKIKEIQEECCHPKSAVTKRHWGNTGNYDPSNDCYGVDYHCTLCDKKWGTVQDAH